MEGHAALAQNYGHDLRREARPEGHCHCAKGATLKKIGTLARHEMETMFSRKIFLEMFVKVQKDWRENPEFLNSIDWRSMRGREME